MTNTKKAERYCLLTNNDIIMEGDEILNDDCETWDKDFYASKASHGRWYIGLQYSTSLHVPTRRRI